MLPPADCMFENSDEAATYTVVGELGQSPTFEKNQLIAKACILKDGTWDWFVGHVSGLTNLGPWLRIGNEPDWRQVTRGACTAFHHVVNTPFSHSRAASAAVT